MPYLPSYPHWQTPTHSTMFIEARSDRGGLRHRYPHSCMIICPSLTALYVHVCTAMLDGQVPQAPVQHDDVHLLPP